MELCEVIKWIIYNLIVGSWVSVWMSCAAGFGIYFDSQMCLEEFRTRLGLNSALMHRNLFGLMCHCPALCRINAA